MFKLTMKSNAATCMAPPFDLNPLTKMWHLVITFQIFSFSFLKYVKLVELAMVQLIGSMEDERCFSTLAFMKSKLWIGSFPTYHLLCACLHNNSTHCKISHMQIISNNGKELAIDIVMMARQYAFCICWVSFCRDMYWCQIEWLFYEP